MSDYHFQKFPVRAFAAFLALTAQACAQIGIESPPAIPAKRVEIDKTTQMLRAYEAGKLVFESRVSTGKRGKRTPSGNFTAGVKLRMHYSRLYDNAPMPFSVQVKGNYFIHGYKHVPERPASHGCIRLPLDGDNPARWFFEWVEPGTPISITGEWDGKPKPGPPAMPASAADAVRVEESQIDSRRPATLPVSRGMTPSPTLRPAARRTTR